MNRKAKAGLAILGLSSALAFAVPAAAQESGFYAGVSFGQSEFSDECTDAGGISCDDKDTAWKIFGGFQFNRYIAAEFGYTNLGEATASAGGFSATAEATAFEAVAVGSFPFANQFAAYGKLGLYRGEREVTTNIPGFAGTDKNTDFTFGFGVRFDITKNLGVRGEWQRYMDVGDVTDIDVLSVGVLWRFN